MRIAFLTLGCKLNFAETSTYRRALLAEEGMEEVRQDEEADLYIVNTCAVTTHSENKCRNIIRRCHRRNPDAKVVVTGCYAQLRAEEVAAIEGVSLVLGATSKSDLPRRVMDLVGRTASGTRIVEDLSRYKDTSLAYSSGDRTRSFLKVQDGCDNFCAYCTVPFARGHSRNRPIGEIVAQAREISALGIKEVVLTGVNTGDFGKSTGETFLDLLRSLEGVEGIERYRISSIEPNLLTDGIIDLCAGSPKFMPHFHIPLQSGSDEILRSMGRRYDTALFASRIRRIREMMESPSTQEVFFGIDIIAGLPGESDELFRRSYEFLRDEIRPAFIHLFPYSPRPGTRAALMPGQVQDSVKTERVALLEDLCSSLHRDFTARNKGLPSHVLWESTRHGGMMEGYSDNYIRLSAPYDRDKVGQIESILL